jgi:L-ascorbate metabolism protein UlaG (beta-lactamase superfamily)
MSITFFVTDPGSRRHSDALRVLCVLLLAGLAWLTTLGGALATCLPIASGPGRIIPAAIRPDPPPSGEVRITYLGHSSFLIETPGGVAAVTDYNGYLRPAYLPDVVTMNNAHSTHYTSTPDPGIRHVLRGWGAPGDVANHDVRYEDLRVRNLPTNVRAFGNDTRYNGNSIFVFEVADLCLAHLGHLHHRLTDQDLAVLGQIDVLFAPIDGAWTMAQPLMAEVVAQIRPAIVIPMHYIGGGLSQSFARLISGQYEMVVSGTPTLTVSRTKLPWGKMIVLPGV